MSPAQEHTDVLIVGAGPVGLFLANECARRGLQWRLVEARPSQSAHSKALAIFPRTLEMLDMAGLVAPFLETANRVTSAAVVAHGRTLADLRFAPEGTAYQFIAMVPQDETERLLAEALRRRGGRVEYDTSLVAAVQDDDRVSATLDRRGERATLSATFVVGCDGAHSTVRHLLNLPFEGAAYDASFLLADVETNDVLPADQLQLCPSERGPVAVFPMSPTRRRIVATSARAEGDAPSLRMVQQILRERAPAGIEARALLWSSYFRIHHRHTRRLRAGRIFIAGDAAHIHSPFGGQGMNTGLHDVWNLAWKLDLAVRGHGTDQLLESYSAERLPAIKDVIATTHRLTTVMASSNRLTRAVRDTVMPVVSRLAPFQRAFVGRLSGLGVSYRGSPIVDGAGQRYFDDSLRGGAGIRSRFLLLVPEDARRSVADAAGGFAALPGEVVEVRAAPAGRGIALVRPDGYVAFSARDGNAADALRSVRSLLQRQTAADARSRGGATAVAPH